MTPDGIEEARAQRVDVLAGRQLESGLRLGDSEGSQAEWRHFPSVGLRPSAAANRAERVGQTRFRRLEILYHRSLYSFIHEATPGNLGFLGACCE